METRLHVRRGIEVMHATTVHAASTEVHAWHSSTEASTGLCNLWNDEGRSQK
jgi:hypothetical protein